MSADAREHPAEHVGGQRAVAERSRPVIVRPAADRADPGLGVRRDRAVQLVRAVVGDVEDRVLVHVVVPRVARAHVEDVLQPAALPGRPRELRQVLGDEVLGREQPAGGEHAEEDRGQRFRARHEQVGLGLAHAVEVALGHDCAVLDHEEPVRGGLGEHVREREAPIGEVECEVTQIALGARQRPHRPVTVRDRRRPAQLRNVPEAPAVVRRVEPVRGCDAERAAFGLDHAASLRRTELGRPQPPRSTCPSRGCGWPHPGRDNAPE